MNERSERSEYDAPTITHVASLQEPQVTHIVFGNPFESLSGQSAACGAVPLGAGGHGQEGGWIRLDKPVAASVCPDCMNRLALVAQTGARVREGTGITRFALPTPSPLMATVMAALPRNGQTWTTNERLRWEKMLRATLDYLYPNTAFENEQKINQELADEIREKYRGGHGGYSQAQLAVEYGVSQPTISGVVTRQTWQQSGKQSSPSLDNMQD